MKRIGYTLTEIMIVLAVLAVLSGAVYFIVSSGRDAVESVDVRAQLSDGARVAMAEMVRDLSETNRDTVTVDGAGEVTSFVDPLNNETHQILIFASARGDPAAPAEDGQHASNDYVHLDSAYKANWRSVVVYCTYVTPEGIQQLRKYVYYNNSYNFPFTFVGVTANAINLAGLVIPRNSGSVRANYITSEVAGPANNNDGVIDNGADFTISGSLMKIKFFLSKLELPTRGGSRMLTATLTDSVVMRNK
jgi:prepilin-type N-terminal cleavage/methylation domain-containing protein